MTTLFEKLIRRELPARIVYENDEVFAFHDIDPQAPVHVLVVPKKVISRMSEATPQDDILLGRLLLAAGEVARLLDVVENGYRVVINNGADAGEAVPHLHLHVLAGRKLTWPPG